MKTIKALLFVVPIVLLLGPVYGLADDDDDDDHDERRHVERSLVSAPSDPTYKEECGSCHIAYPAGLLPARSWAAMMDGLKDHFGENASLEPATSDALRVFLTTNAADRSTARRSRKIAKSIPADDAPLRVTDTLYFKRQHHEVRQSVWSRKAVGSPSNCAACHARAEGGVFSEDEVLVPR